MDHLGWVGSPILMNPSSPWSTRNQDIQESLMFLTSSCSYGSMNDPAEIFFPAQELHKTQAYTHRTGEEVHQCAPASDPMNAIEPSMANFSMLGKSLYISKVSQETRTANSSNTCTSVEDDEIPANFSNTMNIWGFKNVDSSGDSQGKGSPVNELNETVSLTTRSNGQNEPSPELKGGFQMVPENPRKPKRPRWDMRLNCVFNIDFKQPSSSPGVEEVDPVAIAQMKEMVYRAAAFRPVTMGMEEVEKPKRKNVRISSDPQTVAARHRRERISERVRVLKSLVPGGTKMDTASMLHEAANYLKFLKSQVRALESSPPFSSVPFNQSFPHANPFSTPKP